MKRLLPFLFLLLSTISLHAFAQERAYTDGVVTVVTSVRVEPGQMDRYTGYLKDSWKPVMEAQKKAGIIVRYAVQRIEPRKLDDPNLYLIVVYPNMASFDGLDERTEPLASKVTGMNRQQAAQAMADRAPMRTILGSQMLREIVLK